MLWLTLIVTSSLATPLVQDDQGGNNPLLESDHILRVYPLKYAQASDVSVALAKLINPNYRMASDLRKNQLIIHCDSAVHEKIAKLVSLVDIKAEPRQTLPSRVSEIISIKNRRAMDLMRLIEIHVDGSEFRIDSETNSILVNTRRENFELLKNAIVEIDRPVPTIGLSFMVLGSGGQALPNNERTAKLTRELEALDLKNYGIVHRTWVNCLAGSEFSISGQSNSSTLLLEGTVILREQDSSTAVVQVKGTISSMQDSAPSSAVLRSTLSVPLGDIMMVGMAPSAGGPNEPVILVVRAQKL